MITYPPFADGNQQDNDGLLAKLRADIRRDGAMPISTYMAHCLYDADHGYYRTAHPFGRDGDFITAPEISQVFGEILGLWVAIVWQQMGCPTPCNLVELGPGRGTLMSDMLRALRIVPDAANALRVSLVEISETLRIEQQRILCDVPSPLDWPATIADIATCPTILIANEYLDALPVEQWVRAGGGDGDWGVRAVGLDGDGALAFTHLAQNSPETAAALSSRFPSAAPGDIAEIRPVVEDLRALSRFHDAGLVALFIDYGHVQSAPGDTLQAVSRHHAVGPLSLPGIADLTTQVDFAAFGNDMRQCGWTIDGPIVQADFFGALGIMERTDRLMAQVQGENAGQTVQALESGTQRLMSPQGMGGRFKVMAVRTPALPQPPPFDVIASLA